MKLHLLVTASLAAFVFVGTTGPTVAAPYTVQQVTDPTGHSFINLLGINNIGTIAGADSAPSPQGFTLALPSTFSSENFPGSTATVVTAIDASGDTAGFYVDAAGNTHGFTKVGATFTTIDDPNSLVFNEALGINSSLKTVGFYASTLAGTTGQVAYSQSGGAFTDINSLLPSNFNSQAAGINNANQIVGFYQTSSTTSIGFLDTAGVITSIDPFSSTFARALGINSAGDIVGFYNDAGGFQHGFIDVGGTFTSFDPTGSLSTTINGINDAGQIVGYFTDAHDSVIGFVGTPQVTGTVPEPLTVSLFISGLAGAVAIRRRRKTTH